MGRIYDTQQLHNAATLALTRHPEAKRARHALVTVSVEHEGTKAVLLVKRPDWQIQDIFSADHETPGATGTVVVGLW